MGSIWPTVCYAALSGFIAVGFALYEKMRRQGLLDDVQKVLDGKDDFAARESSLAPLARQLRRCPPLYLRPEGRASFSQ